MEAACSRLRQRRAALNGAGEPPAHEGEAEEEQPAGRESRRDGEDDQRGDERDQTGRHGCAHVRPAARRGGGANRLAATRPTMSGRRK